MGYILLYSQKKNKNKVYFIVYFNLTYWNQLSIIIDTSQSFCPLFYLKYISIYIIYIYVNIKPTQLSIYLISNFVQPLDKINPTRFDHFYEFRYYYSI